MADLMQISWEGQALVLRGCHFSCKRGGIRSPAVAKIPRRQNGFSGEGHQHTGLLTDRTPAQGVNRCCE